jgi:hypothetical protein
MPMLQTIMPTGPHSFRVIERTYITMPPAESFSMTVVMVRAPEQTSPLNFHRAYALLDEAFQRAFGGVKRHDP